MFRWGDDKRGISAVITTLIIILLVIVSVSVIWVVLQGFIKQGTEGISSSQFTFRMTLRNVEIGDESIKVQVRRETGEGEINAIRFIFSDGENTVSVNKEVTNFNEFDVRTFDIGFGELGDFGIIRDVSIAPVLVNPSGGENLGQILDTQTIPLQISATGTAWFQRDGSQATASQYPRTLNIGNKEVYTQNTGRGLRLTAISKENLEVLYDQWFDTHASGAKELLTNMNSQLDENTIGVLTGWDAWEAGLSAALKDKFKECGLIKAADVSGGGRHPYAAVFDCSEKKAIESLQANQEDLGLGATQTINCQQTSCKFGVVETTAFTEE